jgi:hypothetical protein
VSQNPKTDVSCSSGMQHFPFSQLPLQHRLSSVQGELPFGRHIVVVEVVLVDVEVVGVVVLVDVEVVGVVVEVLVDVLVVVVGLVWQLPMVSPGCCSRWRWAAASPTVIV